MRYYLFFFAVYETAVAILFYYLYSQSNGACSIEVVFQAILAFFIGVIVLGFFLKDLAQRPYLRNLINLQKEIFVVTDGETLKDANDVMLKFFGYTRVAKFKEKHTCISDFFIAGEGFLQKRMRGESWLDTLRNYPQRTHRVQMQKDKEIKSFELSITPLKMFHDAVIFRDITTELEKENELKESVNFDTLTHIYHRAQSDFLLTKELERASRYKEIFSVILLNIDNFQVTNSKYGTENCDNALIQLTALITQEIRDTDVFGRWGGDEFIIISHSDITQTEAFAEKLRRTIEKHAFEHVHSLTCSFGVTQYRPGDAANNITKRCDQMLYTAKNSGKNQVLALR
ncbi:MAG: GGDEF domain-containing protein [Campylobacterota bacterium]|nr:GGDEF domain-containing protein [Campylobacterota bacterium]